MNRTRPPSLFDAPAPAAPSAPPVSAPPSADLPADWRKPDRGEYTCSVCAGAGCYADGHTAWCRQHVPPGFLPHTRGGR